MTYKLILFSLFLFLVSPNTEDTLLWRDDLKLTWKDFKGKKDVQTDAVAVTASGITFAYSVRRNNFV